jgi:hypothetical protein
MRELPQAGLPSIPKHLSKHPQAVRTSIARMYSSTAFVFYSAALVASTSTSASVKPTATAVSQHGPVGVSYIAALPSTDVRGYVLDTTTDDSTG